MLQLCLFACLFILFATANTFFEHVYQSEAETFPEDEEDCYDEMFSGVLAKATRF